MNNKPKRRKALTGFFFKHRIICLLGVFVLGTPLVYMAYKYTGLMECIKCIFSPIDQDGRIESGILLILLALPTSFCLWLYRNHDRVEQNQFNNISNAMRLFSEEGNKKANAIGLKLLMELKHKYGEIYEEQINLTTASSDLRKLNLRKVNLRSANLEGVNFSESDLTGADLRGAVLSGADMTKTILRGAKLEGAILSCADLTKANLRGADLRNATLDNIKFIKTDLIRAKLLGTWVFRADFDETKCLITREHIYKPYSIDEVVCILQAGLPPNTRYGCEAVIVTKEEDDKHVYYFEERDDA